MIEFFAKVYKKHEMGQQPVSGHTFVPKLALFDNNNSNQIMNSTGIRIQFQTSRIFIRIQYFYA